MKASDVVAITRDGEYICRDCLSDSVEHAVWGDYGDTEGLMQQYQIGVVFAVDLEAGKTLTCGRCHSEIEG